MGIPAGTEYIIPIVVNRSLVAGDISNFLYTIELSNYRSTINKFISTDLGTKVIVYDQVSDTVLTKHIDYMTTLFNDKLIINFVSSTSTTVNKKYLICFGNTLNNPQYGVVYGNVGYTNFWGLNFGGNIQYNNTGGIDGTLNGLQAKQPGLLDYSIYNNGVGTGICTFGSEIIGTGDRTVDIIFKCLSTDAQGILVYNGKFAINLNINGSIAVSNNLVSFLNTSPSIYKLNVWNHLSVTRKATGGTTVYINGNIVSTLDGACGTPTTGTVSLGLLNRTDTLTGPCNAYACQFGIANVIHTPEYIKTRANMFLSDGFFAIDGIPYSNQLSNSLSIGF